VIKDCLVNGSLINKPIIFLGAGASVSAGIPSAGKIMNDIIEKYPENNRLKQIPKEERTYYNIMGSLTPVQRHKILRDYVTSKDVNINVAHIYLAQMLHENKIDYALTVNFDDLLLRACALFNFLPPVYDLSILANNFTTGNIQEKSVTYLHGQHHGLWLLNAPEELSKVHKVVSNLFNKISASRTWIIVGYSGEDEILNSISDLGSFDNNLYWVGYKNNEPSEKVKKQLLDRPNTNAYWISGYDADSFFLQLHAELKMNTPAIFNKPFSFLQTVIYNIKGIDDNVYEGTEHKEKFTNVKERFHIIERQVEEAIQTFEMEGSNISNRTEIEIDSLLQKIIECDIKEQYEEAEELLEQSKKYKNVRINSALGALFVNYASNLSEKKMYQESLEKFQIAFTLNPESATLYHNWGNVFANISKDDKNPNITYEAIEKYKKAIELKPDYAFAYNNWGTALARIGIITSDTNLFLEGVEKYSKAIELDDKYVLAYFNKARTFTLWAEKDKNRELYLKAFECYSKAVELDPSDSEKYNSWGAALVDYCHLIEAKERINILKTAKEKIKKALELGKDNKYNLACVYALMGEKNEALQTLDEVLQKKAITLEHVIKDPDWNNLKNDEDFHKVLDKYK